MPAPQALPVTEAGPISQALVEKARAFAQPLLSGQQLPTGERLADHAQGVADLVAHIGGTADMQAAVYLACACDQLNKPQELLAAAFGDELAHLALEAQRLFQLQRQASQLRDDPLQTKVQIENVRRMLLAFSRDLRVVMLLMASHLQSLRYTASLKVPGFEAIARESLQVFAPLANRLGVWQIKWEMEDLAFRMLEPAVYKEMAGLLELKRTEREQEIGQVQSYLQTQLKQQGITAQVQGRPKNIYSIVKKMRGKSLGFDQVRDLRALRIIVANVDDCYRALSWVHGHMHPLDNEFDDYIAKPKANGYQSLHTVVRHLGQVLEIQIRTQAMHEHAEHGGVGRDDGGEGRGIRDADEHGGQLLAQVSAGDHAGDAGIKRKLKDHAPDRGGGGLDRVHQPGRRSVQQDTKQQERQVHGIDGDGVDRVRRAHEVAHEIGAAECHDEQGQNGRVFEPGAGRHLPAVDDRRFRIDEVDAKVRGRPRPSSRWGRQPHQQRDHDDLDDHRDQALPQEDGVGEREQSARDHAARDNLANLRLQGSGRGHLQRRRAAQSLCPDAAQAQERGGREGAIVDPGHAACHFSREDRAEDQ